MSSGKSAPQMVAPPPQAPIAPPKKEFTPVVPEDTSMETGGKTGSKSLRIDLGGASGTSSTGNGLNITK